MAIPTTLGAAAIADAVANQTAVSFLTLVVGDGNGAVPTPDPAQTALVNQVTSVAVTAVYTNANNPNYIYVEGKIPFDDGGYTIREAGVKDAGGNLLLVGDYPEIVKPADTDPNAREVTVRLVAVVSDTSVITLVYDNGGAQAAAPASDTMPAMPRNAGSSIRRNGNSFPAQKLVTVSGITLSGSTATATATAHGLEIGSTGTLWMSGANETEYNGNFTYTVADANTLTYSVSGTPASPATGTFSAAVDIFEGDAYRILGNSKFHNSFLVGSEIKRFDKAESEVWSIDPAQLCMNAISETNGSEMGFFSLTMDNEGNLVIVGYGVAPPSNIDTMIFLTVDKTTGTTSALTSQSAVNGAWPSNTPTTDVIYLEGAGSTNNFYFSTASASDITRTFVDVLPSGNYRVVGQNSTNTNALLVRQSAIVEMQPDATIVSNGPLTYADGVTPVNQPVSYITADGQVTVGQIFSRYNPWTGEFEGRFTSLARGNTERLIEIPDDAVRFFRINRCEEEPKTSGSFWMVNRGSFIGAGDYIDTGSVLMDANREPNPWFSNGSEQITNGTTPDVSKTGFRAWPEPVKIWALGEYVAIAPCPVASEKTSTSRTFIEGCNFALRSEFDQWLHDVCDFVGLEVVA